jgi:hypothetical protein
MNSRTLSDTCLAFGGSPAAEPRLRRSPLRGGWRW